MPGKKKDDGLSRVTKDKETGQTVLKSKPKDEETDPTPKYADIREELDAIINAKGSRTIRAAECDYVREILSTGCMRLDIAMECGGFPIPDGKIIHMYGLQNSGKSTIALNTIARLHAKYPEAVAQYVDLEHTLETKEDIAYAGKIGVDLNRLLISSVCTGEDAIEELEKYLCKPYVRLAVIDTVRYMMPYKQLDKDADEAQKMGALSTFLSHNMPKINRILANDKNNKKSLICLNQTYTDLGDPAKRQVPYGGNTIPQLASIAIYLVHKDILDNRIYLDKHGERFWGATRANSSGETIGFMVDGEIEKSKVSDAGNKKNKFRFGIIEKEGIDRWYDFLSSGLATGAFKKEGTRYIDTHSKNKDYATRDGFMGHLYKLPAEKINEITEAIKSYGRPNFNCEED